MRARLARGLAWAIAAVIGAAWAPASAHAVDTVTLTSGLILEGDITVENDQRIKIRVNGRVMQFPRTSIASIKYGPNSTAPSQVQAREEEEQDELKEAQEKVKTIKIKRKRQKKTRDKDEEEETATPVQRTIAADGTLIIPDRPTPEEEAAIEELRTGKNKMGACRTLANLKSTYALPNLIRALDDDGPYVRREANDALVKITGQDFGFRFDERKRSVRVEAIKRWQDWYEKASGKRVPW